MLQAFSGTIQKLLRGWQSAFIGRRESGVDHLTRQGVMASTAHLGHRKICELRDAVSDCGVDEMLYEISVYRRENPPFRIVAQELGV